MNRYQKAAVVLTVILGVLIMAGCEDRKDTSAASASTPAAGAVANYHPRLEDNQSVYKTDSQDSVIHMYLTITKDNLTAVHPESWKQLNEIKLPDDNTPDKSVNAILQQGDATGPVAGKFGYDTKTPNVMVKLRGKSTLSSNQKSYKINLYKDAGEWRSQTTINLVKSAYDFSRMRNMLSYNMMQRIPDMVSLRTQYVQLHVRDLTAGSNAGYQNYGLYTQVEQPNRTFLRSHGLDPNGQLYKASNFEFYRYEQELKLESDPSFDRTAFESVLEIKGNHDHAKLLKMLDDVNDSTKDFDEVFNQHFDRDNFLTWMAINILTDNIDTQTQNFMLYSPQNSNTWYFLPWDYDGAWGFYDDDEARRAPWKAGIANYWGSELQNRFFKNPANVTALQTKIKELQSIINREETQKQVDKYRHITEQYVYQLPDLGNLPEPIEEYSGEVNHLMDIPEESVARFEKMLQYPMPFFMGDVQQQGSNLSFRWDNSYDMQADDITYHFTLARTPDMTNALRDESKLTVNELKLDGLTPGRYYWRVLAEDSQGHDMPAFDIYEDLNNVNHYGVREFYVK
ncbi:CotH kinase family protein [Paenibacillus bovis]|uniref:Spore coat protein CotH n=1 Tax=Paenibacillus bovis TaxID=1616788 RepID=A0A172ZBA2_9BACL|nr:CotH kinase family protein [Paenibacillus bovis]ANF94924.1 spore coat protein CotH [Paenibacillus bovis]